MPSAPPLLKTAAALLTVGMLLQPAPASAAPPPTGEVVVVVKVPTPWYAPAFVVRSKMRDAIKDYAALPGLVFKYFTIADDGAFGGIYLWRDRTSAQAWFDDAWFARVLKERGAPAKVRCFDVIRVADLVPGGMRRDDHSDGAATLVTVPSDPSGAPIEGAGDQPGLLRSYDVRSADGRAGRIDLWADSRAADRGWGAERLRALAASRGGDVLVERFAAPILLPVAERPTQTVAAP